MLESNCLNRYSERRGYTLVEILVVLTIIVILLLLTFPSIRAMQAASGRAEAYNTINAALQAARSYAIMHSVKTAARFQPNGKIFLVYRFTGNGKSKADDGGSGLNPYPDSGNPNADGYIYLPVIDQKPLYLPRGYAVADNSSSALGFEEPFYVCYKPDGTLAVNEDIFVALIDDESASTPKLVNPDFNGVNNYAWKSYSDVGSNDVNDIDDIDDYKLAKYCNITDPNDCDHYAGDPLKSSSVNQLSIFKTPENWDSLPIFSSSGDDRATYVNNLNTNQFETIYLNPYTGRVIRPVK